MIRVGGLRLPLSYTELDLRTAVIKKLGVAPKRIAACSLYKRSVDARRGTVCFDVTAAVELTDEAAFLNHCRVNGVAPLLPMVVEIPRVKEPKNRPVVVGSGPAGLFCALLLAKAGVRPLLLERGRPVDQRRDDVAQFRRTGVLDVHSNVQFGEGGAGTFSDGKLNTGIKDPLCRFVLEELVKAGAPDEILWQAKPHVGTDRLCGAVKHLREQILALGGDVRFETAVTDIVVDNGRLTGLELNGAETIACEQAVFAIGHSARDTVEMLYRRGLPMEKKPFAVGVRIEHPRRMIDRARYGASAEHPALGAAEYKLVTHLPDGRGVYTFCMCPGGVVIAAASEEGGVSVNGMSEFARDAENSNSALLVGVSVDDMIGDSPLAGIALQRQMEQAAYTIGGGGYRAPVQLVGDFLKDRASVALGDVNPSYAPGVTPTDLRGCLPPFVSDSLKQALLLFGKQLQGFDRYDAVLTGVESRSSSPVRLLRDACGESTVKGLYPCGEGAGYAGGITSAAVDGIRCARWILEQYQ
ncbi:MAG: FAD-dependent oxidoreductase [Clostridia bacterium]|nr:FAD-dependent oxidoreductase [Clostridia bacterium]